MAGVFFCRWLWNSITMLCDGTITCGLDDPFRLRNYGNVKSQSIAEILDSPAISERRMRLLGGSDCGNCHLHNIVDSLTIHELAPARPYPKKFVVESSIRCNIRCNNSICNINNDAKMHVRDEDFLQLQTFKKAFDEIGPHLEELFFWNYGEPFINPKAIEMLEYARSVNPSVRIGTSTNGLLLAKGDMAHKLVQKGLLDWICFTIGGSDEESYRVYHKASSFATAIQGMRRLVEAKQGSALSKPFIQWRYLLFSWNDKDEQLAEAQRLSDEIGVDEFKILMTSVPLEGRSLRRAPGTPGYDSIRDLIEFDAHYRADPYAEAGLHHLEQHPRLGPMCWTGRKARVVIYPENGEITVRLSRIDAAPDANRPVQINLPWGVFVASVGVESWSETRIAIPTHIPADLPISAEIDVDRVFAPLRLRLNEDVRELGVMVSMRGVSPMPNPHRVQPLGGIGPRLGTYA